MADSLSIDSSSMNTQNIPVIIGIGASAGGLEALEQFFAPIPIDCGVGFVVVQHYSGPRNPDSTIRWCLS